MGETLQTVIPSFNRSLRIVCRTDRLTGDPGAVLLREILERSGIVGWMTARLKDPRRRVDVTHDLASLIRTCVVLVAQGWRDHDDADALRHDPARRAGWPSSSAGLTPLAQGGGLASQPTLSRFTALMAEPANRSVLREAVLEMAGRGIRAERRGKRLSCVTLDVDSAPIEVHGHQPSPAWNGHYNARIYHPLITRVAETGDMLDARLARQCRHRRGRAGCDPRCRGPGAKQLLRRGDGAHRCGVSVRTTLLAGLEARGIDYVSLLRANAVPDRLGSSGLARALHETATGATACGTTEMAL